MKAEVRKGSLSVSNSKRIKWKEVALKLIEKAKKFQNRGKGRKCQDGRHVYSSI